MIQRDEDPLIEGEVTPCIAALESLVPDPERGLPEEVFLFASRIVPLINVDLLIQDGRGGTLLTWREDDFYGAGWHIPGGMIRYKETSLHRVHLVAQEELGATVKPDPTPIHILESITPDRNRGHVISMLYRCRLLTEPGEERRSETGRPQRGQWRWFDSCPADLLPVQIHYAPFFRNAPVAQH